MKKTFILFMLIGISTFVKSQIVNIPDANFKAYLVSNPQINTNGDSQIQVSEAVTFAGTISCSEKEIVNLTGIEEFVKITNIFCSRNQLTSLDLSKNIALTNIDCSLNQLTTLDVGENTALKYLSCTNNRLTNLVLSKNTSLMRLWCDNNQLTTLDIDNNTGLEVISCFENHLSILNVNKNLALTNIYCYKNQLKHLDLTKNKSLQILYCESNQLISLNLKNGIPAVLNLINASDNPNLNCIQVDNVVSANLYTSLGRWQKDTIASYNTDCGYLNLKDISKKEIAIYPNPAKDYINLSEELLNIRITDISGKIVKQISTSEKSVNLSKLAKSTYILSATTKTGETINKKFIKE